MPELDNSTKLVSETQPNVGSWILGAAIFDPGNGFITCGTCKEVMAPPAKNACPTCGIEWSILALTGGVAQPTDTLDRFVEAIPGKLSELGFAGYVFHEDI